MKTTFELQHPTSAFDDKLIIENLNTLENIWNISVHHETASISFEYFTEADLENTRRELRELGYSIINDTHRFDEPRKPF